MAKGMTKRMLIMLIGMVILFGVIFAIKLITAKMASKAMQANQTPTVTVSAIQAQSQQWQQRLQATGSFNAVLGVNVTSEITGLVRTVNFHDGDRVKKNDLLVALNTDTEVALLHQYQAQTDLAQITYRRDLAQYKVKAVSRQQVDIDFANVKIGQAQIAQEESIIAKKLIRAPFSGRLGISPVRPGDYINTGQIIVTLQALDPIYVQFTLPQQNLGQIAVGQEISLTTNLFPNQVFHGKINAINPVVDVSTRNVLVEAILDNPTEELLPGIFALVEITVGAPQTFITLPQTAISFNPYGQVIYLVQQKGIDAKGKPILIATQAFVKVGETRGDQIAILSGVKQGDWIVTSGQLKLKNGDRVSINNKITPSNNPAPIVTNQHELRVPSKGNSPYAMGDSQGGEP